MADNIRTWRQIRGMTQAELVDRMRILGEEWTEGIAGFVERGDRVVTVTELVALGAVLRVTPGVLLDPTGVDGRREEPLDLGVWILPAGVAKRWMRGWITVEIDANRTLRAAPAEWGTDPAKEAAQAALELHEEMARRRARHASSSVPDQEEVEHDG